MDKITTAIFDFDGVIADTETVFARFDCNLINKYLEIAGVSTTVTPLDVRKLAGGPGEEKLIKTGKALGIDLTSYEKDFSDERNEKRKTLFSEYRTSLGKSIKELIEKLGKDHCALATNKLAYKLERDLENMGYDGLFETIITSDPPMCRKPAPDIIIEAMKRLNAKPDECIYIGDNINDMLAAIAANVTPIGFVIDGLDNAPNQAQTLKDHGAVMVIDDFAELFPYIKQHHV